MFPPRRAVSLLFLAPIYISAFVGCPSALLTRQSHVLSSRQRATSTSWSMMATGTPLQLPSGDSMTLFEDAVLKSDLPVLVDFHAVWCAPCILLSPVMEKMASEFEGKLQVVKVDCDTHKDLMTHYRARGLPLMAIFNGGELIARHEGILDYDQTVQLMESKVAEFK